MALYLININNVRHIHEINQDPLMIAQQASITNIQHFNLAAIHLRTINQFLKLVYLRLENQKGYFLRNRNTGKCSCCNSSQDD